ncbi:MAG: hypothetical protein GXO09_02235 [Crenarchaeota archaeon]|nr:hypothetical protein [Thermoproteota archaeon]
MKRARGLLSLAASLLRLGVAVVDVLLSVSVGARVRAGLWRAAFRYQLWRHGVPGDARRELSRIYDEYLDRVMEDLLGGVKGLFGAAGRAR